MSECLTVRLSSEQETSILWSVWSNQEQDVIASGELETIQQLDQLTQYATGRRVVVLLSASDVLLTEVDIPAGSARQFESMLPYLMEDEIAQDVDELHFSIMAKRANRAYVCALEKQWLNDIIDQFAAQDMEIAQVLPDVLALPTSEEKACALQLPNTWLLRFDDYLGVGLESDWLTLYLNHRVDSDGPLAIESYSQVPSSLAFSPTVEWQQMPLEMPMALLAKGGASSKINLLTGVFQRKSSWAPYWSIWRKALIAAALLLVVIGAQQGIKAYRFEQQALAYREQSETIFRKIFPDKRRIPTVSYLKRQFDTELARLTGGDSGESVLNWLAAMPDTLASVKGMEIQSLKYDHQQAQVRLQVSSPDFQSFEQARARLAEHFVVEQGQLNRNGQQVLGSFVLAKQ